MPFTGRAIDSAGVFAGTPEDVSDLVTSLSPTETPFLDTVGDAEFATKGVRHEWLEDSLAPNAIKKAAAVASLAGGDSDNWQIAGSLAGFIQDGTILYNETTGEYVRVASVAGPNTLTVVRGFGGTTTNSAAAADYWRVVSTAQPDGRDVAKDVSRPRTRLINYTQEFMKDIIIAGQELAALHIGVADEWDYQVRQRTREMLIDLERATILSILSGNTIGGAGSVRTMKGLLQFLETNSMSAGSFSDANLDLVIQAGWIQGGTDVSLLMCDVSVKRAIDLLNDSRVRTVNDDGRYINRVDLYENTFGSFRVMMNRWMPSATLVALAPGRIKVAPHIGRSFHAKETSITGDSKKGYCLGEYTLVVRNEAGMAKCKFAGLSGVVTP